MPQLNATSYVRPLIQNTYSYRLMWKTEEIKPPSRFKCILATTTGLVEFIAYSILFLASKLFHYKDDNRVHYWRFAKGGGAVCLVGLQGIIHLNKTTQIYHEVLVGLDNEFNELVKQQHRHMQQINKKIRQQHVDATSFTQNFINCSESNLLLAEKVTNILKSLEEVYPKVNILDKYNTLENAYDAIQSILHESETAVL